MVMSGLKLLKGTLSKKSCKQKKILFAIKRKSTEVNVEEISLMCDEAFGLRDTEDIRLYLSIKVK